MTSILKIPAFSPITLQKIYFASSVLYLVLFPWLPWSLAIVIKPLPIFFLLVHLSRQQLLQRDKILLFYTLIFALLGDIMLALPGPQAFMIGMICFISMHCGYCTLFISNFHWQWHRFVLTVFIIGISMTGYIVLRVALGNFAIPALVYLGFLLSMVFFAVQSSAKSQHLAFGAILFWLSDSLLGFNEFMIHSTWLIALIMACYYVSQWFLYTGLMQNLHQKIGSTYGNSNSY